METARVGYIISKAIAQCRPLCCIWSSSDHPPVCQWRLSTRNQDEARHHCLAAGRGRVGDPHAGTAAGKSHQPRGHDALGQLQNTPI